MVEAGAEFKSFPRKRAHNVLQFRSLQGLLRMLNRTLLRPGAKRILGRLEAAEMDLVAPLPERVDLSTREAFINAGVLSALVARSVKGEDLFEFMPEYIYRLGLLYDEKSASGELQALISRAQQ
jgi:hypothetical protein